MSKNGVDGDSRRTILAELGLSAAIFVGGLGMPSSASGLPGFKKELKPRRVSIPEEQFKEGPQGIKYYDVVEGSGMEAKEGQRVAGMEEEDVLIQRRSSYM